MLNSNVLVLNRSYLPIHVTSVRRAFTLIFQGTALAVGRDVWGGTDVGLSVLSKGRWGAPKWTTFQTTNSDLPHNQLDCCHRNI